MLSNMRCCVSYGGLPLTASPSSCTDSSAQYAMRLSLSCHAAHACNVEANAALTCTGASSLSRETGSKELEPPSREGSLHLCLQGRERYVSCSCSCSNCRTPTDPSQTDSGKARQSRQRPSTTSRAGGWLQQRVYRGCTTLSSNRAGKHQPLRFCI